MGKGVRGLCEFVPGGPYLFDVAGDAYRLFREKQRAEKLREEVASAAAASTDDARRVAAEVAREVAGNAPTEDRVALELYLGQIPAAVRASMKRATDPSGRTVPPDFALDTPADLVRVLPPGVPKFRPGDALPGRPGWSLDELLGSGGFGEVWLTRHTFIPHPRAVKFCTDPLAKAKLASHEGRVIARVMAHGHHPNVVPLLDAALDGDAPWLMYEYVGGGCLTDLVHRWQAFAGAEREQAVAAALHELAVAVGHFHRLAPPIVHRDLKPSNILLGGFGIRDSGFSGGQNGRGPDSSPSPESRVPNPALRITDFGIGGVAVDYIRTQQPRGLSLMSGWLETSLRGSYTPLYASPQQRAGGPPDPRDDVHALGVIGYQMATGRLDQAPGIDAAEDLCEAGVGDGFVALLSRCVAQKAERRPKDAGELAEKLAEFLGAAKPAPTLVPPVAPPQPAPSKADSTPPPFPPREGGPGGLGDHARVAPAPPPTPPQPKVAKPAPPPATTPTAPTRQLIPFRAVAFGRSLTDPTGGWVPIAGKLPGDIAIHPDSAYRLAFPADDTTDATVEKLRALKDWTNLEAVDLSGCGQITDAGLGHLGTLSGLKAVGLADTAVTDSGVCRLLNRLPGLEAVGLAGCRQLSAAVISYIVRLRNLKAVMLPPQAATADVRRELARRLPSCAVN
jgi:serine/threonine protein kinase